MGKGKKHTPEQIVSLLRQIEVAVANGKTTPIACREGGITEQTYYRLRSSTPPDAQ
jgi:putative transposase